MQGRATVLKTVADFYGEAGGLGGDSHVKGVGMLVVSFWGVKLRILVSLRVLMMEC